MVAASAVLFAVANELAQKAKDSLPQLRDGERVRREWLADGVYYRQTELGGGTYLSKYDFRQRASCLSDAG